MYLTPNYNFHVPDSPGSLYQQLKLMADDIDGVIASLDVTETQAVWKYSSNMAMADPNSGNIRTNASVPAAATQIAISRNTSQGTDRHNLLASLVVGDTINLQDQTNSANWERYKISAAPTDNGTWFLIPVTPVSYGGTVPANNDSVILTFTQGGGGTVGGGGPGAVTSVFGRTGDVSAQSGDYTWYQIVGPTLPPVSGVNVTNLQASNLVGVVAAVNGGTGQSGYTIGDILYADTATTLAKLADKATFNVLISGGVGVAPSWGKVNLNNAVTGLLPVTSGGTGTTTVFTTGSVVFARAAGLYTENNAQFFWDNTNFRLGIGTAAPVYKLDVTGVGHFTGGLVLDTPLGVTSGGTGTGIPFTQGSVHFAGPSGAFTQNNANFFWDNTNFRLGLGTNTPASVLHTAVGVITMETSTTSKFRIQTITGVGQWSGISMNQLYTSGNWYLDDTTKEGFKISVISGTTVGAGGVTVDYTPPGPNPHTDGYGLVSIGRDSVALTMKPTVTVYLLDQWTGLQVPRTLVMTPLANNVLQTQNYASGLVGWSVNAVGDAEFNNVSIRGELRTSVFKVNEIAATAGTFGVFYSASTLTVDCVLPAANGTNFTFTAKNSDITASARLFSIGDVVRMKAYVNSGGLIIADAWATIIGWTNNGPTTTYTAVSTAGNVNAIIRAGTAVVDYGPSSTGFITLSTDGTIGATPNMTMAVHSGQPWNGFLTAVRVGNLNGSYGYTANVYGFGAGQYGGGTLYYTGANVTNGTYVNGIFTKTTGADSTWNAGFSSSVALIGDGYIEWVIGPVVACMVGLSYADTDQNYTSQNFSWYWASGNAEIYEGVNRPYGGTGVLSYVTQFRIQRTGLNINYYRDGVLIRTVACTAAPLYLDVGMYSMASTTPRIVMYAVNSGWVTVDNANGVRIGSGVTTRIALLPDGSGYLANNNIKWDISGNMTIANWTINANSMSNSTTVLAAGLDWTTSGACAWFGKNSGTVQGWNIRDATLRGIHCFAGNGPYPYLAVYDTNYRVILGGLNQAWNAGDTNDGVYGMKVYNSSGTRIVEFSALRNQIAGWDINASSITSTPAGTGVQLVSGGAASGLFCYLSGTVVTSADGNRGFDCKIDSGVTAFVAQRCYTISDSTQTIASFHAIEFSATENITYLYTWPITGRNSDTMMVSSSPAGKTAWIDLSCQVGGTNVVEFSMLSGIGFAFWTNGKKRVDIDNGTSMNFYATNHVCWIPQDGSSYGILFANTVTQGGCGGLMQSVIGAYSYLILNSNAPTGGNTQNGIVSIRSADNSGANSLEMFVTSESSVNSSRVAIYPRNGTFKGVMLSSTVGSASQPLGMLDFAYGNAVHRLPTGGTYGIIWPADVNGANAASIAGHVSTPGEGTYVQLISAVSGINSTNWLGLLDFRCGGYDSTQKLRMYFWAGAGGVGPYSYAAMYTEVGTFRGFLISGSYSSQLPGVYLPEAGVAFEVNGGTIRIPQMTNAQRNAFPARTGMFIYNPDVDRFQMCLGGNNWYNIAVQAGGPV